MDCEIRVVAIELIHGEDWTHFPEEGIYGLARDLTLGALQRAVAEMTVHARMLSTVPA